MLVQTQKGDEEMRYRMPKQTLNEYFAEQREREREAQDIYCAIQAFYHHKANAIYEDAIINLVGKRGLQLLREFHLIEACATFNGNKLYAL